MIPRIVTVYSNRLTSEWWRHYMDIAHDLETGKSGFTETYARVSYDGNTIKFVSHSMSEWRGLANALNNLGTKLYKIPAFDFGMARE